MESGAVGLYFVLELVRNVCLLMEDSLTSKIVIACLDVAFLIILNMQSTTATSSILFRSYTIVSFCQTCTNLVYKILNIYPEWLTYLNISIASVDAVVVAVLVGSELAVFFRSKRFTKVWNSTLVVNHKTP